GTMNFSKLTQTSGTTSLKGGALAFVAPLALQGGTLNGAGNITGDVNNSGGDVTPGFSPGNIAISGNYTQGSAATMDIELGGTAAGHNDVVTAGGAATLDGPLNVTLINGFTPSNGNMFTPLTFASRTGDFATKNLPTFDGTHGSLNASYTPTSLVL